MDCFVVTLCDVVFHYYVRGAHYVYYLLPSFIKRKSSTASMVISIVPPSTKRFGSP